MHTGCLFSMLPTFFFWTGALEIYLGVGAKEAKVLGYCVSAGTSRSIPSPSPSTFRLMIQPQKLTIIWKLPIKLGFVGLVSDSISFVKKYTWQNWFKQFKKLKYWNLVSTMILLDAHTWKTSPWLYENYFGTRNYWFMEYSRIQPTIFNMPTSNIID